MGNGCIETNPEFVIFLALQDQHNTGLFAGLERVVKRLADRLCPFFSKIKLDGMGIGKTVAAGFVWQYGLSFAFVLFAPLILVKALQVTGGLSGYC